MQRQCSFARRSLVRESSPKRTGQFRSLELAKSLGIYVRYKILSSNSACCIPPLYVSSRHHPQCKKNRDINFFLSEWFQLFTMGGGKVKNHEPSIALQALNALLYVETGCCKPNPNAATKNIREGKPFHSCRSYMYSAMCQSWCRSFGCQVGCFHGQVWARCLHGKKISNRGLLRVVEWYCTLLILN